MHSTTAYHSTAHLHTSTAHSHADKQSQWASTTQGRGCKGASVRRVRVNASEQRGAPIDGRTSTRRAVPSAHVCGEDARAASTA